MTGACTIRSRVDSSIRLLHAPATTRLPLRLRDDCQITCARQRIVGVYGLARRSGRTMSRGMPYSPRPARRARKRLACVPVPLLPMGRPTPLMPHNAGHVNQSLTSVRTRRIYPGSLASARSTASSTDGAVAGSDAGVFDAPEHGTVGVGLVHAPRAGADARLEFAAEPGVVAGDPLERGADRARHVDARALCV